MPNQIISKVEGNIMTLERTFNAPRELVFQAFTQEKHLKQWWGPKGWELPVCNIDFRIGGVWHYCMKCEDKSQDEFYGMESWGKTVYSEIQEPEKIVNTDYFSDAEGNVDDTMPATICKLSFIEVENGTKVVNTTEYATEGDLKTVLEMGMLQGISETWDRLGEHLEAIQ